MTAPAAAARKASPCAFGALPQQQPAGKKPVVTCKPDPKPGFQKGNPQANLKSVVQGGKKPVLKVAVDPKPAAKVGAGTVVFNTDKIKAAPPKAKPVNAHNPKARKVVGDFGAIGLLKQLNKGKNVPRAQGTPSKAAGPVKK